MKLLDHCFKEKQRFLDHCTQPTDKQHARYVLFPGCNVYFQPELILNALDIMDAVGDDYAFVPGSYFRRCQ
jgi:hypothetical protein